MPKCAPVLLRCPLLPFSPIVRPYVVVNNRLLASMTTRVRDPNTQSNYDHFRTKRTRTDFAIDFARHRLTGEVRLKLDTLRSGKEIVLDTSFLDVHDVSADERPAKWTLDPRVEPLGSALRITLEQDAEAGKEVEVAVSTSFGSPSD